MTQTSLSFASFPFPVLVADIGGTNARFALVRDAHSAAIQSASTATADHPDISAAIRKSLDDAGLEAPKTAIIAVAGPVTGDKIPLTNAHWVIEPRKMIEDLDLQEVIVVNDFEAQALALPGLSGPDIEQIGGGSVREASTKFVLGPGTGLGAAALIHAANTWIPVPGEGGHVELGPVSPEEFLIWSHIEQVGGRLGAEQILSGTGMPRLARAVSAAMGLERSFANAADITKAAEAGDPVGVTTLQVFARALGRMAGDFALSLLARGGVYLTGGVTPRIAGFLTDGAFRASFEAKAPHDRLMASIPTFIIHHPNPALEGLAAFARHPDQFAVEMTGRRWSSGIAKAS
ncbi:glucokinase [Roseibium litorale]|uniref:Glucokinase n=1 Tax=Roseibium litorale TaxID=2803841 RepID=A0ABR9CNB3_9HYPH|nr:glucokinase [Roseibium litorale]MBD8892356.1 glucokinase [Roseibium litorale]